MAKNKSFDPEHKAWLATLRNDDGETFDVIVCVSGEGTISHSRVKAAFKPELTKLVPIMHPVRVLKVGESNEVEIKDGIRYCKAWLLNVFLGEDRKNYELLLVASGRSVLSAERVAMGFFDCTKHMEPFKKQVRIDTAVTVMQ